MTVATPFQSLWAKAGFKAETPIQAAVAEPLRADRDVVGLAPTGSGKTLAFGLPLLEKVVPGDGIQIIILSPSQELAVQTRDVLQPYAQVIGVHVTAITGSANVARQKEQLKKHPEVVVATVGRLLELADDGVAKLHNLETMVVDEADELLRDPGLGQVRDLLQHAPGELQLAFFSATDGPVLHELHKWFGVEPEVVDVRAVDHTQGEVHHYFLRGGREHQVAWLGRLAHTEGFQALVFFNKNASMERAAGILRHQRIKFAVLSRNARAQERKQAMVGFRKGKIKLLLATDLAGRGLDLIKLPAVINFEVPRTATAYIHRAGRTGRMGNPGTVITMGDDHDFRDLKKLVPQYAVERAYVGNHGLTTERPVSEADEQPRAKKRQTKEQANTRVRATAGDAGKQPRLQDAVTGVVTPQKKAHKKNRARNRKNKGKPKK